MTSTLKKLLENKKMVVFLGSGGVGKTTLSASFGFLSAQSGKKTIVLTIDPAKRLANALGFKSLNHLPKKIQSNTQIPLYAMMLDTRHTFDEMIKKYSPSESAAKTILQNRIYNLLSNLMAATTEYMALEQLYELYESNQYDYLVLDTPPAKHLFSFLEAPNRLLRFMDDQILKWFYTPYLKPGKWGLKLFSSGSHLMFKFLEKLTGSQLLHDLSEFLFSLESIYDGFRDRTKRVQEILKGPETSFILVTSPETFTVDYAQSISKNLQKMGVSIDGVIVNRFTPDLALNEAQKKELDLLALPPDIRLILNNHRALARHDQESIEKLLINLPPETPTCQIPFFENDICDINGLKRFHPYLFI